MKKLLRTVIGALFLIFVLAVHPSGAADLDFGEVVDQLSLSKETSLAVKSYWESIRGTEVNWSGKVINVRGGRGKAEVAVQNASRPSVKGYNVVLVTYDMDAAAKLNVGDQIHFSGTLHKYNSRKGHPVVITLMEAVIK